MASSRKDQHDRITNAVGFRLRKGVWPGKPVQGVQHVHEYEARHGGAGMWIDLPVSVLPVYADKLELNSEERQ